MKRIYILLCTAVLVSTSNLLFAQGNFYSGTVTGKSGEEKSVSIEFLDRAKTPKIVRTSESQKPFGPLEVSGFEVNGRKYKSAVLDLDVSPVKTQFLTTDPDVKIQKDTVFLQVLAQGNGREILFLKDEIGKEHFLVTENGSYKELTFRRYIVEGGTKALTIDKYKDELRFYLNSCPSTNELIDASNYTLRGMLKALADHQNCRNETWDYLFEPEKMEVLFGISAGLMQSQLTLRNTSGLNQYATHEFSPHLSPTFALSLELVHPKFKKRWSLHNELSFVSLKMADSLQPSLSFVIDNRDRDYLTFNYSYLRLINLLRVKFNVAGNFQPFLNAGIANGMAIQAENLKEEVRFRNNEVLTEEEPFFQKGRKHEQSLIVGAGFAWNHFSLEIRHEWSDGFSDIVSLGSPVQRSALLLGYTF